MIDIHYTEEFERRYQEPPPRIQRKAERREKLFRENPFHPALKTEKLQPLKREYWIFASTGATGLFSGSKGRKKFSS
jgi:predicted metal-dependent phosphoesterase TrpH